MSARHAISTGGWTPPWRPGLPVAECQGHGCSLEPPRVCIATTLQAGRCRSCVEAGRMPTVDRHREAPAAGPRVAAGGQGGLW